MRRDRGSKRDGRAHDAEDSSSNRVVLKVDQHGRLRLLVVLRINNHRLILLPEACAVGTAEDVRLAQGIRQDRITSVARYKNKRLPSDCSGGREACDLGGGVSRRVGVGEVGAEMGRLASAMETAIFLNRTQRYKRRLALGTCVR